MLVGIKVMKKEIVVPIPLHFTHYYCRSGIAMSVHNEPGASEHSRRGVTPLLVAAPEGAELRPGCARKRP